ASFEPEITTAWETSRWLRLKHTGFFGFLGGWIWGWLATLGALLVGLFVKDPGTGVAQARGILRTLTSPVALAQSRKKASRSRTRPYDAVDELRPSRARVRDHRRSVLEVSEPDRVIGDGTGSSLTPQQATGGHDEDRKSVVEGREDGVGGPR